LFDVLNLLRTERETYPNVGIAWDGAAIGNDDDDQDKRQKSKDVCDLRVGPSLCEILANADPENTYNMGLTHTGRCEFEAAGDDDDDDPFEYRWTRWWCWSRNRFAAGVRLEDIIVVVVVVLVRRSTSLVPGLDAEVV
jgi:hypothetical protein